MYLWSPEARATLTEATYSTAKPCRPPKQRIASVTSQLMSLDLLEGQFSSRELFIPFLGAVIAHRLVVAIAALLAPSFAARERAPKFRDRFSQKTR